MPLYDARTTVRYGAESTVLRSSLSILSTVLVTVGGGSVFRLMGQNVSCSAIADIELRLSDWETKARPCNFEPS
jgi:hypothetical protein